MNYAQTMTEWMGGDVVANSAIRESPYQLKYVCSRARTGAPAPR